MADLAVGADYPEERGDPLPPWRAPGARRLLESSSEPEHNTGLAAAPAPKKSFHKSSTDSMFPDSGDEMLFDGH
jgi:hypothetical protein